MRISVTVAHQTGRNHFTALVRSSSTVDGLFLSPELFYARCGKIPAGPHFELELTELDGADPDELNLCISEKNGRPFMAYPFRVSTLERAQELFEVWCLGSALTLNHQVDLDTVFTTECQNDEFKFRQVVLERFGLSINRSIQVP